MIVQTVRSAAAAFVVTLALAGTFARAEEAKVPKTADEHAALAKRYEEKVAEFQNEAKYHREMAAAYKNLSPAFKNEISRPDVLKMEKHCMAIVKDAEKLATDAEESAKYHRLRAKELEGK
jgi:hypothetical protein